MRGRVRHLATQRPSLITARIRRSKPGIVSAIASEGEPISTTTPQSSDDGEVEVAHEALIRHWPRLRDWLDQDRAALLLRESVREAAQEWERNGRHESYLTHRGRRLVEAEALAHHPRFTLIAVEQAYLDTAIAMRDREAEAKARREAEQRVAERAEFR